ncbi:MAG: TRAP transporter small permease [Rhodospirillales bacterium]|nr:TRAP transporter small permease [Rhodospirillales bacterium]MCW8952541.1 TRAP transporter small permease [Rhodospirillales bacterium]MCW8970112.1 TRAP transporter small permease [Rhodospirillales bacterium]MCW9001450.1 TRAP transporter small permease [Rhodospirillales bacterium]MCW9039636.1 TRAP transporter small permease [Rhodospirillales bacterium]
MRKALDRLYDLSGALAAAFLVAIFVIVLLQVGANLLDFLIAKTTGTPIGLVIPSYAEIAGFFLAAASFLALAHTFRHGAHIRVSLILQAMSDGKRRVANLLSCAAGAAMASYFTYYTWNLVIESIAFGDLSPGIIAVPLWIPQTTMAVGATVFSIAMLDTLVRLFIDGDDPACDIHSGGSE